MSLRGFVFAAYDPTYLVNVLTFLPLTGKCSEGLARRVQIFPQNQIQQYGVTKGLRMRSDFSFKADSYAYEKLIRKWTKSVFFGFFQSYGYENDPDSYGQIRLSFS